MAGNGPQITQPLYASDEQIAIRCRGDYPVLCPSWQDMGSASDGVFANGDPWTMTSATVNFEDNGVTAQNVVSFKEPKNLFLGGLTLMAVDSVSGNSVTLRRIGKQLNMGQPAVPITGATGVKFSIPTLGPQLDNATWQIKDRFSIDEAIAYRNSAWIYVGAEDDFRALRDAVVYTVLFDAYTFESRTERGDFEAKAKRTAKILSDVLARVQVRWGSFGSSQAPTTQFNMKISR